MLPWVLLEMTLLSNQNTYDLSNAPTIMKLSSWQAMAVVNRQVSVKKNRHKWTATLSATQADQGTDRRLAIQREESGQEIVKCCSLPEVGHSPSALAARLIGNWGVEGGRHRSPPVTSGHW